MKLGEIYIKLLTVCEYKKRASKYWDIRLSFYKIPSLSFDAKYTCLSGL